MQVHGKKIPIDTIMLLMARMKKAPFACAEIEALAAASKISVQDGTCMRVAEGLIKRQKISGNIMLTGRIWSWVGERDR